VLDPSSVMFRVWFALIKVGATLIAGLSLVAALMFGAEFVVQMVDPGSRPNESPLINAFCSAMSLLLLYTAWRLLIANRQEIVDAPKALAARREKLQSWINR
jgi:hypothetical protein